MRTAQYRFANAVVVRQDQGLDGAGGLQRAGRRPGRCRRAAATSRRRRGPRPSCRVASASARRWCARRSTRPRRSTNLRTEDGQPHVDITLASGDVADAGRRSGHQASLAHLDAPATTPTGATWSSRRSSRTTRDVGGRAAADRDRHQAGSVDDQRADADHADAWTATLADLAASDAVKAAPRADAAGAHGPGGRSGEGHLVAGRLVATAAWRSSSTITSRCSRCRSTRRARRPSSRRRARCGPASRSRTPWSSHHHLDHSGGYRTAVAEGPDDHHAAHLRSVLQGTGGPRAHDPAGRAGQGAEVVNLPAGGRQCWS